MSRGSGDGKSGGTDASTGKPREDVSGPRDANVMVVWLELDPVEPVWPPQSPTGPLFGITCLFPSVREGV